MEFAERLKKLMVMEYYKTPEEAERLVKAHTDIVMQGIMLNNLDATIMAIEMKEQDAAGESGEKP